MIIRSPGALPRALAAQGAELAFTYQGEALGKRVKPLAEQLGVDMVLPCDVEDIASVDSVFETLREKWGQLDFLVHAIGVHRQERAEGPLCRHHAREFFAHHGDLLLLLHRDWQSAPPN